MSQRMLDWGTVPDILSPLIHHLMAARQRAGHSSPLGLRYKILANSLFGQLGSTHSKWGGVGRAIHEQTAQIGRQIIQADEHLLLNTQNIHVLMVVTDGLFVTASGRWKAEGRWQTFTAPGRGPGGGHKGGRPRCRAHTSKPGRHGQQSLASPCPTAGGTAMA